MNRQPDLKLLRTFVTVVDEGSMTRAADALGYVPSAVSQQIAALEHSLATELLVRRSGSGIEVTPAGRSLLVAARELFNATARFTDVAEQVTSLKTGTIRMGTYATGMCYLLPQVLVDIGASGDGPAIHLREIETPQALPLIRSGELDVLLGYRYLPEDPPAPSAELDVVEIGREPIEIITAAGAGAPATIRDCADRDWITGHPGFDDRRLLQRWAGEIGLSLRVCHETVDPHGSLAMVAAGLAVGNVALTVVLPALRAGEPIAMVSLPRNVKPLTREVLLITRANFHPPVVGSLAKGLADELAKQIAEVALLKSAGRGKRRNHPRG